MFLGLECLIHSKQNTAMNAVMFWAEKPKSHWSILLSFFRAHPGLIPHSEFALLESLVMGKITYPQDWQAQILQKIYCLAQQHDVKFS